MTKLLFFMWLPPLKWGLFSGSRPPFWPQLQPNFSLDFWLTLEKLALFRTELMFLMTCTFGGEGIGDGGSGNLVAGFLVEQKTPVDL